MHANITFDHELLAVEAQHDVHVLLDLTAPQAPVNRDREPLRIALVLDRSGSMAGPKLATVKACGHYLVDRLEAPDRLALVTYDDQVDLLAGMTPVDAPRLHHLLDAIPPGGMTNLSGGLLKGLEEADRYSDGLRRVLLLTDGLANRGLTEPDHLTAVAGSMASQGVSTTTIGVGDDFAETLLTDVAGAGGGQAWYAESVEDLPGIFAAEFDELTSVVAQNVSVEVRPTADVEMLGVLNDYPATPVEGGVQINLGDAHSGQHLRVVCRLHIPWLARLGVRKVADVVLRYVTLGHAVQAHTEVLPVTVNAVTAEEAAAAGGNAQVIAEVTALHAADTARQARDLADHGQTEAASAALGAAAAELRLAAPQAAEPSALHDQADGLDHAAAQLERDAYTAESSKRLHYTLRDFSRDRSGRHRPGVPE